MAKRDRSITALKNLGPVAAYCRLKHMAPRQITLVCLYALQGALSDIHWNKIPAPQKEALRGRVSAALRGIEQG